jgi:peptidyl-prolyl cis-trans isomerase C
MNSRLLILILLLFLSACGIEQTVESVTKTAPATQIPTATHTSIPPTATPIPMAVIINGHGIKLEEYNAEINRYLSALGDGDEIDRSAAEEIVLEDLISQTLLMQGAEEGGFTLTEEDLNSRIEDLIVDAGGEEEFNIWLEANDYDMNSFLRTLDRSIKAAWMRDQILMEVPDNALHVKILQMLFLDGEQANQVLRELESGRDFATIAAEIDPISRGDLGWVPRNFLLHKEIEDIAFSLQPGENSQVIQTSVGYHIIKVLEIEQDRHLNPTARLIWQELALRDWVSLRREASNIEIETIE